MKKKTKKIQSQRGVRELKPKPAREDCAAFMGWYCATNIAQLCRRTVAELKVDGRDCHSPFGAIVMMDTEIEKLRRGSC